MAELVLHHFDWSPYAEKVRVLLGIKGLAWRSVQIPMVMPKPDLTALTGGYRKTPVLQVGADVYCDSSLIAAGTRATAPRTDPVSRRWSGTGIGLVRLGRPIFRRRCRAGNGSQRRHACRPDAGPARVLFSHGFHELSCPRAAPVRAGGGACGPGRAPAGRRARLPARIEARARRRHCVLRVVDGARLRRCHGRGSAPVRRRRALGGADSCDRPRRTQRNSTLPTRWRSRASRSPCRHAGSMLRIPWASRQARSSASRPTITARCRSRANW